MMTHMRLPGLMFAAVIAALCTLGLASGTAEAELAPAQAQLIGYPDEYGLLFQDMASNEGIWTRDLAVQVMWVMIVICLFVLALLIWVAVRYNERANPTASRTTHSTILEVLWTGIPAIIVLVIGILGVRQIIELERIPALTTFSMSEGEWDTTDAAMEINIWGDPSWHWKYELVHFGDEDLMASNPELFEEMEDGTYNGMLATVDGVKPFAFASNMLLHSSETHKGVVPVEQDVAWTHQGRSLDFYQFDVDNRLVVPSGIRIKVNITGPTENALQHAWAVPALGIKRDFWPGRVNSAHFLVPEGNEGLFFGQCSEFCGPNHAYMPIAVHVVTLEEYRAYFASEMAAALETVQSGGSFNPTYYPVLMPEDEPFQPYELPADQMAEIETNTALAQR